MTPQTTDVPSQRATSATGAPVAGAGPEGVPPHEDPARQDLSTASTGELVQRLSTQLSELVRRELELARAELTAKGKRAGAGAGLAGAGGVVALFGVGALITAAIAGLATVLSVWLSALIIGVVLLLVAGVLALAGRSQLRHAAPPVPEQAVHGVQEDVATVKGAVHR
ncbi:MAG TPA: phage holin family protein [Pseudonocardia sp.]|nr:phage holin family protein [Pseudonocardia sp.]